MFVFKPQALTSRYQMELRDAAEDDRDEMEAVEALASLARSSAFRGGGSGSECPRRKLAVIPSPQSSQAQPIPDFPGNASSMVTSASNTGETVKATNKIFSRSYQSNSGRKSRRNLTEAEKEERRLHRVLANRESARQTIRRRQAMYLELTMKAADLSAQNQNLKMEKEVAVKEYTSLKGRNEFLKLQMANVKKAKQREKQEQQKSSQSETATSATISSPSCLDNHPSLAPCFCPFVPYSNVIQLQYSSHADVMTTSQFSTQYKDISSWHLGQGNPMFVLPVPWLLPLSDYCRTLHSNSDTDKRRNKTPSTHLCSMSSSSDTPLVEDKHELPSDLVPEKLNCIRPATNSQGENINNLNATSVTDSQSSPKKNPEFRVCENSQNMFAATKARRRRKELMRLKNIHYLNAHTHSANC